MSIFGLFKKDGQSKPLKDKDINLFKDIFGNSKSTLPVNFAQNVL